VEVGALVVIVGAGLALGAGYTPLGVTPTRRAERRPYDGEEGRACRRRQVPVANHQLFKRVVG
jgi:hypothetical protein